MVWKAKKSRRPGNKNAVYPSDYASGTSALRSCLRVGLDEKLYVNQRAYQTTESADRDQSIKSARSILSAISGTGSSKSRDTGGSDDNAKSLDSGCSGDSLFSGGRDLIRCPQHRSVVSGAPEELKYVRFGVVAIREHERAIGDNPSCSTGPPIGYAKLVLLCACGQVYCLIGPFLFMPGQNWMATYRNSQNLD